MPLAPSAAYDRDFIVLDQKFQSYFEPTRHQLAIAVDKLHKADGRIMCNKCCETFVSCPRRTEG